MRFYYLVLKKILKLGLICVFLLYTLSLYHLFRSLFSSNLFVSFLENSVVPANKPKSVHDRFWELSRNYSHSNQDDSAGLTDSFTLNRLNLWRPNNLTTSLASPQDDRLLAQLVWILEAESDPDWVDKLQTKNILLYDTFEWWNFKGNEAFRQECPGLGRKCIFLDRPNVQSGNIRTDAVITVRDFAHMDELLGLPESILRFFFILESGFHSTATLRRSNDLLASYWSGSDLHTPYGKWVYYNQSDRHRKQEINYAVGKKRPVAGIISNCDTHNNRALYIQELQKYISVDVYGDCGSFYCPKDDDGNGTCFEKLRKDYKFYLAFENSNCRDYISEKLFHNALSNNMVPVVFGAHPDDYKAIAPENSYIHVEDFPNPRALANYLLYLHERDEEYNKYFAWKGLGEFIGTNFLCRVCGMTHYSDLVPPQKRDSRFTWEDIGENKLCLPPNTMYWNSTADRNRNKRKKSRANQS